MPASSLKRYTPTQDSLEWRQWSPWLARAACVLLGIWLIWLAVRLLLLVLSGPEVVVNVPAARQINSAQQQAPIDIANWHLFGQAAVSNPLNLAALPETQLDLELRGIVSGTGSDQQGHAIIIDNTGRQWVYAVGDTLPGGATVRAITPDQVVLERNEQNETLSLPRVRNQAAAAAANQQRGNASGQLINATPRRLIGLRGQPQAVPPTSMPAGGLSGVQLDTANLQRLSQSVQVTPVNGGYKVFPGRDATVFRQLGLQANDVITAVNGQPLNSVQAAMQIFQNLNQTSAITLSVRRGNQVLQLQPDVAALGGQ